MKSLSVKKQSIETSGITKDYKEAIVSVSLYYNSYAMEHNSMNPVNYDSGEGIVGNKYRLRAIYHRYYTYNPENLTLIPKWKP